MLADISQTTHGQSNNLQSIVSDGDKTYVLANNNRIIEISGGSTTVKEFDHGSWPSWGSLWDYQTLVQDHKILHLYRNDVIYGIDLESNSASKVMDMPGHTEMILSQGEIYLVSNSNSYYKYQNGFFASKRFNLPNNIGQGYSRIVSLTFHKGSPAFLTSNGKFFYYID